LDALIEKQQFPDAIRFLAHALPKREAVWWACVCARGTTGPNPPPKITAALQAAEKWCSDPSEDNRRATQLAADAAELATPAGCAGGSLAPANVPVVPPGENLTAHGVTGSVMLAAVLQEPEKAPEKFKKFLAQGIEVGNGASKWK